MIYSFEAPKILIQLSPKKRIDEILEKRIDEISDILIFLSKNHYHILNWEKFGKRLKSFFKHFCKIEQSKMKNNYTELFNKGLNLCKSLKFYEPNNQLMV